MRDLTFRSKAISILVAATILYARAYSLRRNEAPDQVEANECVTSRSRSPRPSRDVFLETILRAMPTAYQPCCLSLVRLKAVADHSVKIVCKSVSQRQSALECEPT